MSKTKEAEHQVTQKKRRDKKGDIVWHFNSFPPWHLTLNIHKTKDACLECSFSSCCVCLIYLNKCEAVDMYTCGCWGWCCWFASTQGSQRLRGTMGSRIRSRSTVATWVNTAMAPSSLGYPLWHLSGTMCKRNI